MNMSPCGKQKSNIQRKTVQVLKFSCGGQALVVVPFYGYEDKEQAKVLGAASRRDKL